MVPSDEQPSAENRDIPPYHIIFPRDSDCGIPPKDIPISIVFNGFDHYVGTKPKKPTFKDGLEDLIDNLNSCIAISGDLIQNTDNAAIKQLLTLLNATDRTFTQWLNYLTFQILPLM